jgi:hypothetical protein
LSQPAVITLAWEDIMRTASHRTARLIGGGVVAAAALGLGYIGTSWLRYGRVSKRSTDRSTSLDRFLPTFEVIERHHTTVAAPAVLTFAAAREMDLMESPVVRAVLRGRELLMRLRYKENRAPQPLIDEII